MRCTLEQQDFGAHLVHPLPQKQARSFLLCFLGPCASCAPCAGLCHRQAQGRAGTTVCQTAAAARWFPGVVTVGVEVRAHCFCGEIASESLKLVHLALNCCRKRLGESLIIFPSPKSTYKCRSYSEIGAWVHGRRRKAAAMGADRVVHP